MDLLTFIKNISTKNFLQQYKTVCFRGLRKNYPLLFFSRLFQHIKAKGFAPIESIDSMREEPASVMAKLSTSFLGSISFYWLKNLSELKPKKQKQLVNFLKSYAGPNGTAFFVDETVSCKEKDFQLTIMLPEKIDQKSFECLAAFFEKPINRTKSLQLFKNIRAIGLDDSCLLLEYAHLSGRSADSFVSQWMDKIVEPEHSLIELSKQFFARDPKLFFPLWSKMSNDYSVQFWIIFWSEQLWRAYNFIEQSNKQQFLEAKRISFRLPFIFTQRLWRNADKNELRNAHDFLYKVDCSQKNGGAPFSLELFYSRYFSNQF